jgi:predicted MPP superfamily phosphohydrolase
MHAKKRHHYLRNFLLLFIVLLAVLMYDSITRIVTTEYELQYENLPSDFDGFRIVQLSDLHGKSFGEDNSKLVDKVQAALPDIIVITGDLIDRDDQGEFARTLLRQLTDIAPVFYVTGNHEWDSDGLGELLDILDECGVTVLRNEFVTLTRGDSSIVLAGVDDPNGYADMKTPEELVEEVRTAAGDSFLVMLCHRNDKLDLFASLGVDLLLSGHAHGGIIRLPFTDGLVGPARDLLPTYTSGVYTNGTTNMVVSRGLGSNSGYPPIRLLNNPHIPVIILRSA